MSEQFIRDLAQKLADENATIDDWTVRKEGTGALLTVVYELTPAQAGYLHCIAEHEEES